MQEHYSQSVCVLIVLMRRLLHAIQDEEEQEPEVVAVEDRARFESALPVRTMTR